MEPVRSLLSSFTRNWWVFLVQGILAVIFGVLLFVYPIAALVTLALFYFTFVLVDSLFAIYGAFVSKSWWLGIYGVLGILVGIYAIINPGIAAGTLLLLIAFILIVRGVMEVVTAIQLRKELEGEWVMILAGVLSVILGVFILTRPAEGALSVAWVIGMYAIFIGILYIILSFRVRSANKTLASA
ncbi:MAG: HdeD family acid-resistance protein [Rhodothermales bacterium]|nr:HdeD family acid-resistance protein [Rhodothermales bacterium]